ncbi:MAG: YjhG/YagF family D-xylonate dehydratase [Armatimonadota bacterium]
MSEHLFRTSNLDFPLKSPGPDGSLDYTPDDLLNRPSGDLFGISQNAGMSGKGSGATDPNMVILSTLGGWPGAALGAHTGHNELYKLVETAAQEFKNLGQLPFALYTSDTCDGRTQGTIWANISLASRNIIYKSLATQLRGIPCAEGVLGIATCDKGLPAMTMLIASLRQFPGNLPGIIVPGGVTLPPEEGEDAGTIQSLGARFAKGLVNLDQAQDLGCKACATPGGGCQFFGTAATAQCVAEAMGLALPHSALAPSGFDIWTDLARDSASAIVQLRDRGIGVKDILTEASIRNAMVIHAAMGGSTNLLLHIPAIAHAAGLRRPTREDFLEINLKAPRIVDCLPTGVHPTVRVFMAGGVPEVMLHLAELGLLDLEAKTVTGHTLGENLEAWRNSERRRILRERLQQEDGVEPDDVILPAAKAKQLGFTSTVAYPTGNIAPEGSVVKATSIHPRLLDVNGVYHKVAPCRTFTNEASAIQAVKDGTIQPGEVVIIMCRGPLGAGMPETYEVTAALKGVPELSDCALITDARFSGVTTGPCFGHVSPEALVPGSPLGKLQDGDMIEIKLDTKTMIGSIDALIDLESRATRTDLERDPYLPDYIQQWALVQHFSGGVWGGCVEDIRALTLLLDRS